MANFNFEDFVKSNEKADGSLSLTGDQVSALLAGYKDVQSPTASATASGDANTQLNAGLSADNTASLYGNCTTGDTTQPPAQQPPASDVGMYDPQRPYGGAGVQVGAERAFNRGDRAFNSELNIETNMASQIGQLEQGGLAPVVERSIKHELQHEIKQAQNLDHAGRDRFFNGARALGVAGAPANSDYIQEGRAELRPKGDLNAASVAISTGDYSLALNALSDRQGQIMNGISSVRFGVNGGDFVNLSQNTAS